MLNEAPRPPTEIELSPPLEKLNLSGPRRAERRRRKPCQATAKTGPEATRKLVHPVEQAMQDDKDSAGAPSLEPMVLETAVQTP
ncbi:MAG: hypothetical protein ACODUE_10035, partial [Synechococcus sp.]